MKTSALGEPVHPLRGTGRTTRMIKQAVKTLDRQNIIVMGSMNACKHASVILAQQFSKYGIEKHGTNLWRMPDADVSFLFITPGADRLNGMRGATVYIDHWVMEKMYNFPSLDELLHKCKAIQCDYGIKLTVQ